MQAEQPTAKTPAWKSPWVIGWVASILLVLAMNLFMVYMAVRTNPGLVVNDYYERGQDYEKHMVSRMVNDPGWGLTIGLPEKIIAGEDTPFQFTILDKAGVPVAPEQVVFYAYRPSDATRDFSVPMDKVAAGLYTAKAKFRLKGAWDILVSATVNGQEYHKGRRIKVHAPE